jgi:hypothetical protein
MAIDVELLERRVAVLEEFIARMHLASRGVSVAEYDSFKERAIERGSPLFEITETVLQEPRDDDAQA